MKKIMVVFGTRPEVVKMYPVVEALKNSEFQCEILTTAQHREMLDVFLKTFAITPDIDLDIMQPRQTLPELTARIIQKMELALAGSKPDLVLVQGDTTTVMATALAAFYQKIPVGHVEAGLRTDQIYDPFPEEINRRLTGQLATLHFAPTQTAEKALLAENIPAQRIFRTGNTVIDAILKTSRKYSDYNVLHELNIPDEPGEHLILMTAHRRENWGQPLENICRAVQILVERYPTVRVVFPVHKNPVVRDIVFPMLGERSRIHLVEPLDYVPFMDAMRRSYLVLTDSGGLQEEAPSLGKPVLVLRLTTERPEGVEKGTARLIGIETEHIVQETALLLDDPQHYQRMAQAINPYGDGHASERIVASLRYYFGLQPAPPEPFHVAPA